MKFLKELPAGITRKYGYDLDRGENSFCFIDESLCVMLPTTCCLGFQKEYLVTNRSIFDNSFGMCFSSNILRLYGISHTEYAEKLEDLIHKADKTFGFKKTEISCLDGSNDNIKTGYGLISFFFFKCDKKWLLSPVLYNLFGALVRNVTATHKLNFSLCETLEDYVENGKDYVFRDKSIMKDALQIFRYMSKYGIKPFFSEKYTDNWVLNRFFAHSLGMSLCNYYFTTDKFEDYNYYPKKDIDKARKIHSYICRFKNEKEVEQWVKENSKKQRKVKISVSYEAKSKKLVYAHAEG